MQQHLALIDTSSKVVTLSRMISVRRSIEHLFSATLNMVGVYGMDARETNEVPAVQREYLADPVCVHGSGKSCVMDTCTPETLYCTTILRHSR